MKIKYKLNIGYAIVALFTLVVVFVGSNVIKNTKHEYDDIVNNTIPLIEAIDRLRFGALRLVSSTSEFGFISAEKNTIKSEEELKEEGGGGEEDLISQGKNEYYKALSEYEKIVREFFPEMIEKVKDLKETGDELLHISDEIVELKKQGISGAKIIELKEEFEEVEELFLKRTSSELEYEKNSLSQKQADLSSTIASSGKIVSIVSIFAFFTAILFSFLTSYSILKPINELKAVALKISKGNLSNMVNVRSNDEIGLLGTTFNTMTVQLKEYNAKIEDYAKGLEDKVKERTVELEQKNSDLKDAQAQLILSEKMAGLGVLVAGIAHEINTPIGAIVNASLELNGKINLLSDGIIAVGSLEPSELELLKKFLGELANYKGMVVDKDWRKKHELIKYLEEIQIEKADKIATFLSKYNMLDKEKIDRYKKFLNNSSIISFLDAAGTIQLAQEISSISAKKIAEIVSALKYYAYTDMAKLEQIDLNESIDNCLILMHNKFKYKFDMNKSYGNISKAYCSSSINQVWTNLLSNAYDAVTDMGENYRGVINIKTYEEENKIKISINNNGRHITKENLGKIFDPFFTTKGIGKGTGMGLSIVSGIIKKHGGEIAVESEPENTTFTVSLPKDKRHD